MRSRSTDPAPKSSDSNSAPVGSTSAATRRPAVSAASRASISAVPRSRAASSTTRRASRRDSCSFSFATRSCSSCTCATFRRFARSVRIRSRTARASAIMSRACSLARSGSDGESANAASTTAIASPDGFPRDSARALRMMRAASSLAFETIAVDSFRAAASIPAICDLVAAISASASTESSNCSSTDSDSPCSAPVAPAPSSADDTTVTRSMSKTRALSSP